MPLSSHPHADQANAGIFDCGPSTPKKLSRTVAGPVHIFVNDSDESCGIAACTEDALQSTMYCNYAHLHVVWFEVSSVRGQGAVVFADVLENRKKGL